MKLTKKMLREMVKKELKEFTTSAGGTRATRAKKADATTISTQRKNIRTATDTKTQRAATKRASSI